MDPSLTDSGVIYFGPLPRELPSDVQEKIARLRSLTMEQRSQMIKQACRMAAEIYKSRLKMGLPPVKRAQWPASTWEFLRKHAPNGSR